MIVHKYKLEQDPTRLQEIEIPGEMWPLSVGEQYGELYLWAMTRPASHPLKHRFYVLGTGTDTSHIQLGDLEHLKFLNTVQMSSGLVWHVFYA